MRILDGGQLNPARRDCPCEYQPGQKMPLAGNWENASSWLMHDLTAPFLRHLRSAVRMAFALRLQRGAPSHHLWTTTAPASARGNVQKPHTRAAKNRNSSSERCTPLSVDLDTLSRCVFGPSILPHPRNEGPTSGIPHPPPPHRETRHRRELKTLHMTALELQLTRRA